MAHGGGLWFHFHGWRLWFPSIPVLSLIACTQQIHVQLLQLLAPQRLGLGTLGVVTQIAVARQLQGPDQAVQRAAATPGVVIDTEVGEARQRETMLL